MDEPERRIKRPDLQSSGPIEGSTHRAPFTQFRLLQVDLEKSGEKRDDAILIRMFDAASKATHVSSEGSAAELVANRMRTLNIYTQEEEGMVNGIENHNDTTVRHRAQNGLDHESI